MKSLPFPHGTLKDGTFYFERILFFLDPLLAPFPNASHHSLGARIGFICHNQLQPPHQKFFSFTCLTGIWSQRECNFTSIFQLWQLWRRRFSVKIKQLQQFMSQQFPWVYPKSHLGEDTEMIPPSLRGRFQDIPKEKLLKIWPQDWMAPSDCCSPAQETLRGPAAPFCSTRGEEKGNFLPKEPTTSSSTSPGGTCCHPREMDWGVWCPLESWKTALMYSLGVFLTTD